MAADLAAGQFVSSVLAAAQARLPELARLGDTLRAACAIRLRDMVDHIIVPLGERAQEQAGWRPDRANIWRHPNAAFPPVIAGGAPGLAFRVERLERLLLALQIETSASAPNGSPLRRAVLFEGDSVVLHAVERNGSADLEHTGVPGIRKLRRAAIHQQVFRTRRRFFRSTENGLNHTERLVEAAVADLGQQWACHLFLRAEREYWLSRCEAGVLQKRRQDRAGVGWCTLNYLVYCSSRENFHRVSRVFQRLGYQCGEIIRSERLPLWSAQVFEHVSGMQPALLVEVDLADESDCTSAALQPLTWHGPAGLWCAMHGESLLEGGVSRLCARYDIAALSQLVARDGMELTGPCADTARLRHRFTPGQPQAVSPARIDALESGGYLARRDAETLRLNGAVATYLQAVESDGGFAGSCAPDFLNESFGGREHGSNGARDDAMGMGRRAPVRLKRRRSMRS